MDILFSQTANSLIYNTKLRLGMFIEINRNRFFKKTCCDFFCFFALKFYFYYICTMDKRENSQ